MVKELRRAWPKTLEQIAEVVRDEPTVISGAYGGYGLPTRFRKAMALAGQKSLNDRLPEDYKLEVAELTDVEAAAPGDYLDLSLREYRGIVEIHPEDLVVQVRAGTTLASLQDDLAEHGLCLPLAYGGAGETEGEDVASHLAFFLSNPLDSVGTAIDLNLPHGMESVAGTWRDWILGMTVVLADGRIAKSGSRAVKNVAGYDLHRFFVGARGTLGIVAEVTLRVLPKAAKPACPVEPSTRMLRNEMPGLLACSHGVARVPRSRTKELVESLGDDVFAWDAEMGTVWAAMTCDYELGGEGWLLRANCGEKNLRIADPAQIRLMKRAKEIFDPTGKLNPGEMGIF